MTQLTDITAAADAAITAAGCLILTSFSSKAISFLEAAIRQHNTITSAVRVAAAAPDDAYRGINIRLRIRSVTAPAPAATDISDIRHISLRTAKYFCSSDELDHASVLEDPTDELVRLWTRKECLSKLDGSGLYTDFKTLTKDKMGNICTLRTNNYYCSYYSTTGEQTPRIITVAEIFEALK